MTGEKVSRLEKFQAPYGRDIMLDDVVHESGMRMLRITIREGKRFTVMDIDAPTAAHWSDSLAGWAKRTDQAAQ